MDFLEELEKTKLLEEKIEERRMLHRKLSVDKEQIEEEEENLLINYSNLSPLNLVNTIETMYPSIIHSSKFDSLNTLSSYKSSHNIKFDLLDFELKKNISKKLKIKIGEITCTHVSNQDFFIGDKKGTVKMYTIINGNEIKSFLISQNYSPVSVLENIDNEYILVGHNDGSINLYDIKKGNLLNSLKDVHSSKILSLKYSSNDKNNIKIISSDEDGQVFLLIYNLSKLKKKPQTSLIFKHTSPIYTIVKFNPMENESKVLLGFASINKVFLYTLEPKLEKIFELKKPEYLGEDEISDISLGYGTRPISKTNTKKLSENIGNRETFFAIAWGNVIHFYCVIYKAETFIPEGPIGYFENNIGIIRLGFISPSIIYFFDKTAQLKIINTSFCDFGKYEANEDRKFVYNKNALIDEGKILDPHMKKNNISKNKEMPLYTYINYIYNLQNSIYLFTEEGLRIGKVLSYKDCIEDIIKISNNWFGAMCLAIDIYQGNMTSFPGVPSDEKERKKKLEPYLIDLLNKYIEDNFKKTEKKEEELDEELIDMKEDKIIECINVSIEFCFGIKIFDYLLSNVQQTFNKYGKQDMFYKLLEPFIFNDILINEDLSETFMILLYKRYSSKKELDLLSHFLIHINLKCLSSLAIQKLASDDNLFSLIIFIFSNGASYHDYFKPIKQMFQFYISQKGYEFEFNNENKKEYNYFNYCEIYGLKGLRGIKELEKSKEYVGHKLLWYIEQSLKGNKLAPPENFDLLKFNVSSENYKNFVALIFYWILQKNVFLTLLNFDSYSFLSTLTLFFTEQNIIKILQDFKFTLFSDDKHQNLIKVNIPEKKESSEENEKTDNEKDISSNNKDKEKLKYNDLNNVLLYIINLIESNKDYLSHQDLDNLLIKYATYCENANGFPEIIKSKIFEAVNNIMKYFSNYTSIRQELIRNKKDLFNCHSLSKDKIDINNSYFSNMANNIVDLLNCDTYMFTNEELNEFSKNAEKVPFTMIKIKINELLKNYDECLNIFFENKEEKIKNEIFDWLDKIFSNFSQIFELEKNNNLDNNENKEEKKEKENKEENIHKDRATIENEKKIKMMKEELNNLRQVIIDKIEDISKIGLIRTKYLIEKYFLNNDKLIIIDKLNSNPKLQLEFLNQLLNPTNPSYSNQLLSEEEDKQYNNYLLLNNLFSHIYKKEKEIIRDRKIKEKFENLFLKQINLLILLNQGANLLNYIEINIKLYPNYPLRKILNEVKENDMPDTTIFLYQALGESKNALNLNKPNLDKAFISYLKDEMYDDKSEFLQKLNKCINICKENSESLAKKEPTEESKQSHKEGEDLWFNLLETLYKYEEDCEKEQNFTISQYRRKKVQSMLQKCIADLLKRMCLYVGIQNLVEYLTENQNRAQYKEFKSILESMLRTNTSFNRVISNTMTILKRAINNYENERKKVILKGNNYNYKKCDVCQGSFENSKNEIMLCFGCGHQSHKKCCYKRKLKKEEIINGIEFAEECMICHQKEIENEDEDKTEKEKEFELNDIKDLEGKENEVKRKVIRHKNDRFKRLNNYDKKFENEMAMFY